MQAVDSAFLKRLLDIVARRVNDALSKIQDGRTGGYFCLADEYGNVLAIALVGSLSDNEKAQKYLHLCQEKAQRLGSYPSDSSSWQSRNPDEGKWGGAIIAGDYILSFSGLPEMWDEAAMIVSALILGLELEWSADFLHDLDVATRASDNKAVNALMSRMGVLCRLFNKYS